MSAPPSASGRGKGVPDPLEPAGIGAGRGARSIAKEFDLLRRFVRDAPVAIAMFDRDMRYLAVSRPWLDDYGLTGRDIAGHLHYDIFPELPERWKDAHRRGLAGETLKEDEDLYQRSQGDQWVKWVVRPWYVDDDEVGGIVIFTEEITARKNAERKLAAERLKFRHLADIAIDYFWETDCDFRFTEISPSISERSGIDWQAFIGKTQWEIPIGGVSASEWALHRERLAKHESFRNFEATLVNVRGELRWFSVGGDPIFSEAGEFQGYRGVAQDITSSRNTENELAAARYFAAEVLDSSSQGLVVLDRGLRVMAWNRFIETYSGLSRDVAIGRTLGELMPDLDAWGDGACFDRALEGETIVADPPRPFLKASGVFLPPDFALAMAPDFDRAATPDLALSWLQLTFTPLRSAVDRVIGVIVTFVDLTSIKRVQDTLAVTNERLRRLTAHLDEVREEERKRIAREVHDELGSTIMSIRMHLQAARADAAEAGGTLPRPIQSVDQLLEAASLSVRRIISDLRPSVLDHLGVWAAVEWYATELEMRAGIEFDIDIAPEAEAVSIDADRATAIFRIAQEGLTNVLRHAHASHIAIRASIEDDVVVMEVRDNGLGITEKSVQSLGSVGIQGMRERAQRYRGTVSIRAAATGGTVLLLRLPLDT